MFGSSFPLLDVFLSILWFALWVLWVLLVAIVIVDVFRSHDLSGIAKAAWLVFVLLLPVIGVFVYLIARGTKMRDRQIELADSPTGGWRLQV